MESFRQFYIDHREKLFKYLLQKSGSTALAADLMQESFTRYLERYGDKAGELPLLFTIGRNLFYDQMRRPKSQLYIEEKHHHATTHDQETSYLIDEQTKRVQKAFLQLTDEERDMLSLAVNSDLGYKEIANIHRCSVANVKVRVHRARKKIRNMLEDDNCG